MASRQTEPLKFCVLPHTQVLLHLDSSTWANGCLSQAAELQGDVREALHAKRKVVLVHEMDASRGGEEDFGYFFGVTPQVRVGGAYGSA